MRIFVPKESRTGERRVAITPDVIGRLKQNGLDVTIESGAGASAGFGDELYRTAGATISPTAAFAEGDVVASVVPITNEQFGQLRPGTITISFLPIHSAAESIAASVAAKATSFSLEAIPRISRAQSMDALTSQALCAGYRCALIGAELSPRFFPLLMTAAGTVKAARVVILGVGVAGLQAIATAKRLGAVIEASDVRPSVKEQVESLGAKFIDVPYETQEEKDAAEGVGGYAKPMPPSWLERQKAEVAKRIALADIVITTALIPGRPAPVLVTEDMVRSMKAGSVIVDLAAAQGGNCPLTVANQTVNQHGVVIIGETNLPALVAADASSLYARNVLDFLKLIINKEGALHVDMQDDIVAACLMTQDGQVKRAS